MNRIITLALAAASAADARVGCGRGYFRGPAGHCRPMRGGPVVVAPGLVIGGFYPHRGYWDGRRYYERRERWHGGWRYR